jgi:hypothetical protein
VSHACAHAPGPDAKLTSRGSPPIRPPEYRPGGTLTQIWHCTAPDFARYDGTARITEIITFFAAHIGQYLPSRNRRRVQRVYACITRQRTITLERSDDHQVRAPHPPSRIECHVTLQCCHCGGQSSATAPAVPGPRRAPRRAFQLLCRANSTYFRLQSHNLEYRLPESTLQGHSCFRGCAIAPAAQICAFQLRCANVNCRQHSPQSEIFRRERCRSEGQIALM